MTSTASTAEGAAGSKGSDPDLGVAVRWLAWVIGLALAWYILGFATHLGAVNVPDSIRRDRLALPLYPNGYGRLLLGALVASTLIGLFGRRASRVYPAGLLAMAIAWALTYAALPTGPRSVYGNVLLVLFGTVLLAVSTVIGLSLGVWGARILWRRLVAVSVLAAVAGNYLVTSFTEAQNTVLGQATFDDSGSASSRWLTWAALFLLALWIVALGKGQWLLLTATSSVVLPLVLTTLGYLTQLLGPGVADNVAERIFGPIADLIPSVLSTPSTWWPPLAVLLGGVLGLIVWQVRRGQRTDMPVLAQPLP